VNKSSALVARFGPVKIVVFSTLIVALFFAAAEVALRTWVYFFRTPAESFDVSTGTFVLQPGVYPSRGKEPIRVNTRGFVGAEFEDPPPQGVIRIVALGDSCTFGQGNAQETYPAQLELRLNRDTGSPRYQVINAGIEGLNSELALRRLESKVIPLRPDIVTIYIGWNDLMKFDPTSHGESRGLGVMARAIDRLWLTKGLRKLLFYYVRPHLSNPATGPASHTGKFREYRPVVFETNLRAIIASGRKMGAEMLAMTLPTVVSDDMTLADIRRANVVFPYFGSAYAVVDYLDLIAAYNRSIRRVASEEEVLLVDLATEIDGRPDRRRLFLDTMHPNEKGRELIADILARHLRGNGYLRSMGDRRGASLSSYSRSRADSLQSEHRRELRETPDGARDSTWLP
jgi:lysophospholipase L1-like esterase